MILKDILSDCVLKLGYGDRINFDETEERTQEAQKVIDILLRSADIVYAEICTNHILNTVRENVTLTDNRLEHNALKNMLVYTISLKQNGISRRIKQYPSFIESNFSGDGVLEYVSLPEKLTLNSNIPDTVPCWLIADGIVSEYAFANNLIDIAVQHERKYHEGLSLLKTHGASKYVKARRWV